MTYDLLIGDKSYSSWSLRGWLLFKHFDIPVTETVTELYSEKLAQDLVNWSPAKTVPSVRTPDGGIWSDSLAIAEGLAEAHPDKNLWPNDPVDRALARSVTCEMHSGFSALRKACPMNLRLMWTGFEPSEDVLSDLARIQDLWASCRSGQRDGPWLFGAYSIADAFYAPVAARIAGYELPVNADAQAYVAAHLSDPHFRQWRAEGEMRDRTLNVYDQPLETAPWPDPLA